MEKGRRTQNETVDQYMKTISKFPLLTKDEEVELSKKRKRGDRKAEERMIESNLRLVVKVASEFSDMGVPLQDLINEGNIGLMKAVRKFDPSKGKLSTYAVWWIKQCVRRAVGRGNRTVRLPVHMHDKISKIRKLRNGMVEQLGREPTETEIAEETGIPVEKISLMLGWGIGAASLDAPLANEGDPEMSLMDVLGDDSVIEPAGACQNADMAEHIENLLSELKPREREVVCRRFGIGRDEETLEEIGEDLKVTRERIRQVQADAIRKMNQSYKTSENRAKRKHLVKKSKKSN